MRKGFLTPEMVHVSLTFPKTRSKRKIELKLEPAYIICRLYSAADCIWDKLGGIRYNVLGFLICTRTKETFNKQYNHSLILLVGNVEKKSFLCIQHKHYLVQNYTITSPW